MRWLAFLVALCAPTTAHAEASLARGPAPSWVVAVEPPPSQADAGGLEVRLVDSQTHLDDSGVHQFGRQIHKFNSPAALQGAGSLAITWQPALGSATVHTVTIRRNVERIDVLQGEAKFNIIRREEGLEARKLTGLLTAVLQVPDLRVGDELEFSYTIDRHDPTLGGHNDAEISVVGMTSIDRLYVRASWPKARAVAWRIGERLPRARREDKGDLIAVVIDGQRVTPPPTINGAPARYLDGAAVQVTDFGSWREVAQAMAPLYDKASHVGPNSPVQAEVRRIAAASPNPSVRAALALQLVQSDVRYFARLDGLGGYLPESAETVWLARSGDCKGKTALLLALLRGLGIEAEPAMVSTTRGDGLDKSLPMLGRFDHVVVRAEVGGKIYWLDGSKWGERTLERLATPPFRWALPLGAKHMGPEPLPPIDLKVASSEWRLDLDARGGLSARAEARGLAVFRGEQAIQFQAAASIVNRDQLDQGLRKMWRERHDWLTIDKVTYEYDETAGEVRLGFTGTGQMDWDAEGPSAQFRYEANKARLGQNLAPERDAEVADLAPVAIDDRYEIVHQTILLPDRGAGFSLQGEAIDQSIGGVSYSRTLSLRDGRFDMTTVTRSAQGEISFSEAKAADRKSDALYEKAVFIRLPDRLVGRRTAEALSSADPTEIATLQAVLRLEEQGKTEAALAELGKVKVDGPTRAHVAALRGLLLAKLDKADEAMAAFDEALALDRTNFPGLSGKITLLLARRRAEDALILADRLVLVAPENEAAYRMRGYARRDLGDEKGALADWNLAVEKQSSDEAMYEDRLNLLYRQGLKEQAYSEADILTARFPDSPVAHAARASMLARAGRRDEAKAATIRSLEIQPNANAYMVRIHYGFSGDAKATLVEMVASIRLEPDRTFSDEVLRRVISLPGARAQLEAAYDAVKPATAEQLTAWKVARAAVADAAGEPEQLLARYDEIAAQHPKDAGMLNNVCWARATRGVQLDKALIQCDAAIALKPHPAYFDSRGLVRLRLKAYGDAIADYDAALAQGNRPMSLFGRGIAKLRAGNKTGAAGDLAEARKLDANIDERFAAMGLQP